MDQFSDIGNVWAQWSTVAQWPFEVGGGLYYTADWNYAHVHTGHHIITIKQKGNKQTGMLDNFISLRILCTGYDKYSCQYLFISEDVGTM